MHGEHVGEAGDFKELFDEAVDAGDAQGTTPIGKHFADVDEVTEAHAADIGKLSHVYDDVLCTVFDPRGAGQFEIFGIIGVHPSNELDDGVLTQRCGFYIHVTFRIVQMGGRVKAARVVKKYFEIDDVNLGRFLFIPTEGQNGNAFQKRLRRL